MLKVVLVVVVVVLLLVLVLVLLVLVLVVVLAAVEISAELAVVPMGSAVGGVFTECASAVCGLLVKPRPPLVE